MALEVVMNGHAIRRGESAYARSGVYITAEGGFFHIFWHSKDGLRSGIEANVEMQIRPLSFLQSRHVGRRIKIGAQVLDFSPADFVPLGHFQGDGFAGW